MAKKMAKKFKFSGNVSWCPQSMIAGRGDMNGEMIKDDMAEDAMKVEPEKRLHRRKVQLYEQTQRYMYRRAYSEVSLLDVAGEIEILPGVQWNFITGGDVDSLSYVKLLLRKLKKIDYILMSTWCMSGEDVMTIAEWHEKGLLGKIDFYVGEVFPNTYKLEMAMLTEFVEQSGCGRLCVFRNHSKVYAGYSGDVYFAVQSSANINTNPRCEQGAMSFDKGLYEFYRAYYDSVEPFKAEKK